MKNSFVLRGKGWSWNFPSGLLTHWGLQSRRKCWPCLWWREYFILKKASVLWVNWLCIEKFSMENELGVKNVFMIRMGLYRRLKCSKTSRNWGLLLKMLGIVHVSQTWLINFLLLWKVTPSPKKKRIKNSRIIHLMIEHKCMTPWQVPIQSNSDCQEKVLGSEKIESSMLCAGGEGSGTNKVSYDRIFKG